MIVGHLGVAAALGRGQSRTTLAWLLAASLAPDLLDIGYALVGFCSPSGLYSHTVPIVLLLTVCLGSAALLAGQRAAVPLVALVVLLHLPMDFVTGHKLFWPGGEMMGLRLYERPLLDFLLEAALLVGGWALLRPAVRVPRWTASIAVLVALLLVQGAADLTSDRGLKPNACSASLPSPAP